MTTAALSTAATTRLPAEPRLHRVSPRKTRTPRRPRIRQLASDGQHHAQHLERVAGDVERRSRRSTRSASASASSRTAEPALPTSRGTAATSAHSISAIIGTVTSTHRVIIARAHGVSTRFSGDFQRCGSSPSSVGRIRW